jgi:hypothetical protein
MTAQLATTNFNFETVGKLAGLKSFTLPEAWQKMSTKELSAWRRSVCESRFDVQLDSENKKAAKKHPDDLTCTFCGIDSSPEWRSGPGGNFVAALSQAHGY